MELEVDDIITEVEPEELGVVAMGVAGDGNSIGNAYNTDAMGEGATFKIDAACRRGARLIARTRMLEEEGDGGEGEEEDRTRA